MSPGNDIRQNSLLLLISFTIQALLVALHVSAMTRIQVAIVGSVRTVFVVDFPNVQFCEFPIRVSKGLPFVEPLKKIVKNKHSGIGFSVTKAAYFNRKMLHL